MKKAKTAIEAKELIDIPNIGKAVVEDLHNIGITKPNQLKGQDPLKLYNKLTDVTGVRHDPCMLDTFMAAVDFMEGGKALPWWKFTPIRKKRYFL